MIFITVIGLGLFLHLFAYYWARGTQAICHVWKSKENSLSSKDLAFSVSGTQVIPCTEQVIKHSGKGLYPLSNLKGPLFEIFLIFI